MADENAPAPGANGEAVSNDEMIAEMAKLDEAVVEAAEDAATPPESEAEPEKTEDGDADAEETEPEEEAEKADDAEEGTEAEAEPEVKADDKAADEDDPKLQRRLEKIHAAEKRGKDALAAERAEFTREREALAPRLKELEAFDDLKARAAYDPVAVIEILAGEAGVDHDYIAKQFYYRGAKAQAKPEYRELADRERRLHETEARVKAAEQRAEKLEQREQEREQRATEERNKASYIDNVAKAVTDESPIVKAWIAKAPEKARSALWKVANRLSLEEGGIPEHADVLEALEKERRQELEDAGVDVATVFTTRKPMKKKTSAAGEKKAAIGNAIDPKTKPRGKPLEGDDLTADVLKGLEAGEFEA